MIASGKLASLWHARSARERSILSSGLIVIAVMLAIALLWLPLERTRARLGVELPLLRASLASMQRDAAEAKRLRALPATMPSNPAPLAPLIAANAWSRDLPGVQLSVPDEKHVRLAGADVGFGQLLDWLATAQAAHGLRVETARIEALAAPGRVRAELTLARN